MNCKDIEAAKRLIAQFEERADGRHNSTALEIRKTETKPVEVEKTNELPVVYHPVPELLPFQERIDSYFRLLYQAMRLREGTASELNERASRFRFEAYEHSASWFPGIVNLSHRLKPHWQECEIGDYCQIPEAPFEDYNPQQVHRMILPRKPDFGAWAFAVPQDRSQIMESLNTYLFQQAILWNSDVGSQPFWKRIE